MKKHTKIHRMICTLLSSAILITGNLCRACVTVKAATNEYAVQLKNAGFPDSYLRPLCELHQKYPKWKFEAVNTGLDWKTVIEQESKNGVNLVPRTFDDATKSTAAGAYNWETNTWKIYDGSSWVAAAPDYIAYYMDPRNFLNETDIYQFEGLSYNEAQTLEGVESILKGTFMAKDVIDTDKTKLNYAQTFMDIGQKTGVSPYHLASRVRQEQGLYGTSTLISGQYKGYEGYFNYFNVNAAGASASLVIKNGLAYAKKVGWDTRYKALLGGAQLLSRNYIAVGQDTLYFQKFNVVNTKKLYTHQYMANLIAARNEGRKLGQGYENKQQAFVFRIPVYEQMPDSNVTFNRTGNPNNYLRTLTVSGAYLAPEFDPEQKKYSVSVADTTASVKISAVAVAPTSTITGTGTVKLKTGVNTVKIKCKSASGDTRTYTLKITRKESEKPNGIPVSGIYAIEKKTITGIEPGTQASVFLKNLTAKNMKMKLVGADGKEIKGTVGTGTLLQLYDKDNKKLSTYTLVVYGDVNGDGKVDELDMNTVHQYILKQEKLTGYYLQAADTDRKNDGVTVLDLVYLEKYILGTGSIKQ